MQPLEEDLLLRRGLLVLTGLLVRVGLGRLWLVKLFEAEGLLLFGGDTLALAQLTLHVLHLLPQVAVGFLQGAHLLGESTDPLLLLEQSLLHCGAQELEETKGNEEFTHTSFLLFAISLFNFHCTNLKTWECQITPLGLMSCNDF